MPLSEGMCPDSPWSAIANVGARRGLCRRLCLARVVFTSEAGRLSAMPLTLSGFGDVKTFVSSPLLRLLGALLFVSAAWSAPADALEPVVERAYKAGKQALAEQRPEDALFHFKKALARADGASGTTWQMLLAVGVTYSDLKKPIFAREYFQRFLAVTEKHRDIVTQKWKDRRERVMQTLADMEVTLSKTHAFVLVTSTPPGAALRVGGKPAGADANAVTPFSLVVPAGSHALTLTLAGQEDFQQTIEVKAGEITTMEASLVERTSPSTTPSSELEEANKEEAEPTSELTQAPQPTLAAQSASEPSGGSAWAPWVVIASAGALAAAGGAMTGLAAGAQSSLDTLSATPMEEGSDEKAAEWAQARADLDTYNTLSVTLYAVAGAAAIGGVVWLLLGDDDQSEASTAPALTVSPTQGGLYGHAAWRF